jgi:NAD(P)-dependent dehydrogenase (short-subunit alcohol dehydrogenase family)
VNNAGVAFPLGEDAGNEADDIARVRERYSRTFNTNITSVATVTAAFLPLLRKGRLGTYGKVVNIGSGRGSLGRSMELPRIMVKEYRYLFSSLFCHFPL